MAIFRRKSSSETPELAPLPVPVAEPPAVELPAMEPPVVNSLMVDPSTLPIFEEQHVVLDSVELRLAELQNRRTQVELGEPQPVGVIKASMGRVNDLDLRAAIDVDDDANSDFDRRFAEFASHSDEILRASWMED